MPRRSTPQKNSTGGSGKKKVVKARTTPNNNYLPPQRAMSVDGAMGAYGDQLSVNQKQEIVLGKKKKKPRAFKKKIVPENATPYMKFRLEFMNKFPKLMRGKSKSERTNIIKRAWGKKLEKPGNGMTPYILFRTKYINDNRPQLKGLSKRDKTERVKSAWKTTSAYQKFKLGYICQHHESLQALNEKEKTKRIKDAWGDKKKELIKETKLKGRKGPKKVMTAAKIAEKSRKELKRKEKKHKEWLRKLGRTVVPVPEGEKVSDYIVFRYGFMDIHRTRFEHMKEKERTEIIKNEWNKQKKKEEIRAIARITKRKREEVVNKEAEKLKKDRAKNEIKQVGAYTKGELTPYQVFRAGYTILYGLDISKKETTDKVKAAWKDYQTAYLEEVKKKMKRDKDLDKEKRRLKRLALQRKKRRRSKSPGRSTPRPKSASDTPSRYMIFRQKYKEDHKSEIANMTEREITSKIKIAWWEDAPNRKAEAGSSSRPRKKAKKSAFTKTKKSRAAIV